MMNDEKKLKRGLKDISDLFVKEQIHDDVVPYKRVLRNPSQQLNVLAIYEQNGANDRLHLYRQLIAQMTTKQMHYFFIQLQNDPGLPFNQKNDLPATVQPFDLSHEELEQICSQPLSFDRPVLIEQQNFIIDASFESPLYFPLVLPLLDKWVFFIEPNIENLIEIHKLIKGTFHLNEKIEYYLLFKGDVSSVDIEFLYEKFSEILSRHLGVDIVCLGVMSAERSLTSPSPQLNNLDYLLNLEHVSLQERDLSAKWSLLDYMIKNHSTIQAAI